MSTTTKTVLWIIVILVVAIGAYAYFAGNNEAVDYNGENGLGDSDAVVCTMDAKLCPDGSYVGRIPPNCEFAACPGSTTGTTGAYNDGVNYPADIAK
jgi:hypothetical protein